MCTTVVNAFIAGFIVEGGEPFAYRCWGALNTARKQSLKPVGDGGECNCSSLDVSQARFEASACLLVSLTHTRCRPTNRLLISHHARYDLSGSTRALPRRSQSKEARSVPLSIRGRQLTF
jgi:hypothetical protein